MANLDLAQLNEILGDYFETMPPIDPPDHAAAGPIRLVGDRVSLGDGKDPKSARGLENIQVFQKQADDTYAPVSMQTWLENQVKNGEPQQLARKVNELLDKGLLLHYDQGRIFPSRPSLDKDSGKLVSESANPIRGLTEKPKLSMLQKIAKAFGLFFGKKAKSFDSNMLDYSMNTYIRAQGRIRTPVGTAMDDCFEDTKGWVCAKNEKDIAALQRNIREHRAITDAAERANAPISELKKKLKDAAMAADLADAREETKRFDADLTAEQKEAARQKELESRWTPLQDRAIDPNLRAEKIRQQDGLYALGILKSAIEIGSSLVESKEVLHREMSKGIAAAMDPSDGLLGSANIAQIKESTAMQRLCKRDVPTLLEMIKKNEVVDRFAHIIMTDPGSFPKIKLPPDQLKMAMQNLCDHCIDPPARLQELAGKMEKEQNKAKSSEPAKQKSAPEKNSQSMEK